MDQSSPQPFLVTLLNEHSFVVKQKKELLELAGFETRNKYSIEKQDGTPIAFAAEDGKGLGAILFRHFLGHWRTFSITIFDTTRVPVITADHPFRILFSRLIVKNQAGETIGAIQQRFSIIHKSFDIVDESNQVIMTTRAPIWKPWTFPIKKEEAEVAMILKRWGGVLKEAFTDADQFTINFHGKNLNLKERQLILAATLLIDLVYFENKGSS
jgi:hypothetical protein